MGFLLPELSTIGYNCAPHLVFNTPRSKKKPKPHQVSVLQYPDCIQHIKQAVQKYTCVSTDNIQQILLVRSYPHKPSSEVSGANHALEEARAICHLMAPAHPILRQRMSLL